MRTQRYFSFSVIRRRLQLRGRSRRQRDRAAKILFFFGYSPPASATGTIATTARSRLRGYSPPAVLTLRFRWPMAAGAAMDPPLKGAALPVLTASSAEPGSGAGAPVTGAGEWRCD